MAALTQLDLHNSLAGTLNPPSYNTDPNSMQPDVVPCYFGDYPCMAGFMHSFPIAILHAPYKYFGLGITNLYHKQGIQHLLSLLHYRPNPDDNTGKLMHLGLETLCLELGINGQIFSHDWQSHHLLVTPTWLSHTWCFQTEFNIRIEMSTPEISLSREGNQFHMVLFFQAGIHGKQLATLNCCCIFLQVATLADIMDGSGYYISMTSICSS